MIINKANLAAIFTGFQTLYIEAYNNAVIHWDKLAMRAASTGEQELYAWLGAIPGMKEILDEVQIQNLALSSFAIRNKEWSDTIPVRQMHILTDKLGVYSPLFSALGAAGKQHPDELVANLLLGGFSNTCYTGSNFFDTKHEPVKGGKTFSNKGTAKRSADSFSAARANIRGRLNAKGRPMNLGNKLVLVVSPQNEAMAKQILQADFIAQTAQEAGKVVASAAVSNVNKGAADIEVLPQLAANPDAWFLLDQGSPVRPLIVQFLLEPKLSSLTSDESDHVFKKHEFLYQAYGIYNAGYGLPEMAYGSTGTA